MADHGPVKLRESKIEALIALYKAAYKTMVKTISNSTDAGKIQKARVMAQINKVLSELGVDVKAWVKEEIPKYYLDGANSALQDLRAMNVDITKAGMAVINREAIVALVDETALAFAEGITGLSRSTRRLLDNALKQQLNFIIAEGRLTGEARRTVSANVEKALREDGLTALVDRGGKTWQFDTYAEMLVRTKAVEARNTGLQNRMTQNGYDLVQVTNHRSTHPVCAKYESKILSLTGAVPVGTDLGGGHSVFATYDQAKLDGLFHPNCQHAINPFNAQLASITKAYDNPFNQR